MKKSFNTLALMVIICCFTIFLSGCNANKNVDSVSVLPPTQTTPQNSETQAPLPNNETQIPDSTTPTKTASPSEEIQTPDSTSTSQINPSESEPVTALETGLDDGTEVKLIVSDQELDKQGAVIMGGEAFVSDYEYVFGHLKDAGGIESAGFSTYFAVDTSIDIEIAFIANSQYSIKIVEGEYSFICNDETIPLTVPAQKINGQFMVPLKAIAEAINATVKWDETTQTISFFY